jgi:hypothetical protein
MLHVEGEFSVRTVFISLVLCFASISVHSQQYGNDPIARPVCGRINDPTLQSTENAMCNGKMIDSFAEMVNKSFVLPKQIWIVGKQCGQANAFYEPDKSAIVICYELAKKLSDRFANQPGSRGRTEQEIASQAQIVGGAMAFAFLHELGHALIDLYSLPVLGREEDAADKIATFLIIIGAMNKPDIAKYWTVGAHWFFSDRSIFAIFDKGRFANEHSVNQQRQYNIVCWIYGSDTNKYLGFARYAKLPNDRAQRCPSEYQQMLSTAKDLLAPHVRR